MNVSIVFLLFILEEPGDPKTMVGGGNGKITLVQVIWVIGGLYQLTLPTVLATSD